MCIQIGTIVTTNYGTGPYEIKERTGPCTCTHPLDSLEGDETPSREHYHFVVTKEGEQSDFYLNGYYKDVSGRILNAWNDDEILISEEPANPEVRQACLF